MRIRSARAASGVNGGGADAGPHAIIDARALGGGISTVVANATLSGAVRRGSDGSGRCCPSSHEAFLLWRNVSYAVAMLIAAIGRSDLHLLGLVAAGQHLPIAAAKEGVGTQPSASTSATSRRGWDWG